MGGGWANFPKSSLGGRGGAIFPAGISSVGPGFDDAPEVAKSSE